MSNEGVYVVQPQCVIGSAVVEKTGVIGGDDVCHWLQKAMYVSFVKIQI